MKYHIHHGGQLVGIFTLEELQRRRAVGELTGEELAWCPGMTAWEPLEVLLQRLPPPLPKIPHTTTNSFLLLTLGVFAVLAIGLLVVFLAVPAMTRLAPASKQRASLRSAAAAREPLEPMISPDSLAKGTNKLTLATYRVSYHEFLSRQWLQPYAENGPEEAAMKQQGQQLLELRLQHPTDPEATDEMRTLSGRLVGNKALQDPLLLIVVAETTANLAQSPGLLERALQNFPKSHYRAYLKIYATVKLIENSDTSSARKAALNATLPDLMTTALSDGSFEARDTLYLSDIFLHGWCYSYISRHAEEVVPVFRAAGPDFQYLALLLEGEMEMQAAWKARGSGFANTVTEQGFEGFTTHMAAARKSFVAAWKLRPDLPYAPSRMIKVAMSEPGGAEMRLWFNRALEAQIDHSDAWTNMRWGLRPRWHGDLDSLRALGVAAVDTRRFDTLVPHEFFEIVRDLEQELDLPTGRHIYGETNIWPSLRKMYEGYLAEPSQHDQRADWATEYASVAYLAGHYDVARDQLASIHWQPAPSTRNWGTDISFMPFEVAARTGLLARQVAEAERLRKLGDLPGALRTLTQLPDGENLDPQTRTFIRQRTTLLTLQQRLQSGEWVDLPAYHPEDELWHVIRGQWHALSEDGLEAVGGWDGHLMLSRLPVGPDFEIRGEFEFVKAQPVDHRGGIYFGMPNHDSYDWFAVRFHQTRTGSPKVSYSLGWGSKAIEQPVPLNKGRNSFDFTFAGRRATLMVNEKKIFHGVNPPVTNVALKGDEIVTGVGGYSIPTGPIIHYYHLQVRKAPAQ